MDHALFNRLKIAAVPQVDVWAGELHDILTNRGSKTYALLRMESLYPQAQKMSEERFVRKLMAKVQAGYLLLPPGKDLNIFLRDVQIAMLHKADLSGEGLLNFRVNKELLTYCHTCANSAKSPLTGALGCAKGDDPDVKGYFEELDRDEHDEEMPRCPMFVTDAQTEQGTFKGKSAFQEMVADFVKELPPTEVEPVEPKKKLQPKQAEHVSHTEPRKQSLNEKDWVEEIKKAVKGLLKNKDQNVRIQAERINRAMLVKIMRDRSTMEPEPQEYSYVSFEKDKDKRKKQATSEDVSRPEHRDEFLQALATMIRDESDPQQQLRLATDLLSRYDKSAAGRVPLEFLQKMIEEAKQYVL